MSEILNFIIGSVLPFVIMLGTIVFVHELGHFLTAKKFGVYCGEFSLGMGPILYKKQVGETQYSLRALPIGGFVSMAGEADDTKKDEEIPFERTINGIKTYKQIIVMLAGIVMNILLAWVIFIGLNMASGQRVLPVDPIVGEVFTDSIASDAGFKDGDRITKLTFENGNSVKVETFNDIVTQINYNPETIIFSVDRNGETLDIEATPKLNEDTDTYQLGIAAPPAETESISFFESFEYGTKDMINSSTALFESLGRIFQGKNLDQLSGPVGIFKITADASANGVSTFFRLLAILSINIGVMNALPLPILDGGRALIVILEKITKRKINERVLNSLMWAGAFALIALMVFATYNDFLKLF